jgi:hypothetical protein
MFKTSRLCRASFHEVLALAQTGIGITFATNALIVSRALLKTASRVELIARAVFSSVKFLAE